MAAVAVVTAVAVVMAATNYICADPSQISNRNTCPQLKTTKFVIRNGILNSKGQSATRVNLLFDLFLYETWGNRLEEIKT